MLILTPNVLLLNVAKRLLVLETFIDLQTWLWQLPRRWIP